MNRLVPLFLCGSALLLPAHAEAQAERYELGRHLRAFEAAWQGQKDAAVRRRALPALQKATQTFLNFLGGDERLAEAGRLLDQARFALSPGKGPAAASLWAESLCARPEGRFLDTSARALSVRLLAFYKVTADRPKNARLRLKLLDAAGKRVLAAVETPIVALPLAARLPLKNVPEGDYRLRVEIVVAGKVLVQGEQTVSCAARLAVRLAALNKSVAAWAGVRGDTQKGTVRGLAELLGQLAGKQAQEIDYPAARLLGEAEAAVKEIAAGKPFYGRKKPGQFWLTLAVKKWKIPARLQAPPTAALGKPLPLLVVIHGTGGSENIYFDGHGPALVPRLCRERGWLLVAPRSSVWGPPPVADVIAEVNKLYPVDPKRVFLFGHSIGGTHAVNVAQKTPARFAGVAALAPAGAVVRPSEALKRLPFFIAVGRHDFLRASAHTLDQDLKKAGVKEIEFHDYPDLEHLTVVVDSLPAVFKFFDRACRKTQP